MKIAFGRHSKGDRISCKRYRKSCNAYSDRQNAHPSAGRRGPFSSRKHRIFTGFNQRTASSPRFRYIPSKPAAPCLRYFRTRGWAVHSAPLLEVNKCEEADCTLCPGQRCARPMGELRQIMIEQRFDEKSRGEGADDAFLSAPHWQWPQGARHNRRPISPINPLRAKPSPHRHEERFGPQRG